MSLKQRLDQKQVQRLILAPALQQAIKLLPLTNLELVDIIDAELAQNPMIEVEDEVVDRQKVEQEQEEGADIKGPGDPLEGLTVETAEAKAGGDASDADLLAGFQEYLDEGFRPHFSENREAVSLENTLSRTPTLWDHLNWQASLTFFEDEERRIAAEVIGNINEDGFLDSSVEELARLARTTPESVEAVRQKVKMFDPVGCGSLDLSEALLAQMDNLQIQDPVARAIVTDHLALLEKSDYAQLAKVLGVPPAEVRRRIDLLRSLDPAPGRKYSEERTSYVVPDIIVSREGDEWKVELNEEGLPSLRFSAYYRRLLAQGLQGQPEAYRFLKERFKQAVWFLRSLNQRSQTIHKVARFIVDRQKDFLEKGLDHIRPMTLLEIAREVGVHESTVGRVVANKHMLTPRGVIPLKLFFHKALQGESGEDVSSLRVKERIRKLVESEDKDNPLSDIEIGEILARENLRIARRTVAKYRQQLGIEPSHIRKRKSFLEERP